MANYQNEPEDAAPSCPHDLEPYWAGSPVGESFAPGVLDETALVAPHLAEETPWRGRNGPSPDRSRMMRPRRPPESGSPAALAAAQELRLEVATAEVRVVEDAHSAAGSAAAAAAEDMPALGVIRVLVVHPSLATRRQVASALGGFGFEVATCGEAEQAVLQVLHERPDAVVAEIGAPDLDALALCRAIGDRSAGTPVLLVAPGDDEAHTSLAMEAGAADYLRRPITPELMAERVRATVRRARGGRGMAGAGGDVRLLDRQLRRQELKIQSLFELSRNVVGCLELDELYHGFLLTAMGQLGLGAGVLYHLDGTGGGRLLEVACRGLQPQEARRLLDFRAGLGAYLLRTPHPVLLEPDCCPTELHNEVEALRQAGLAVACPMASKGMPVGVALFGARVTGAGFSAEDLLLLSAVCNFAGPALDSARLYTELHLTYLSTVRAFVSSLEAKDAYTRGHSERVADYARVLGQAVGVKRRDLDMVIFGAMLHDIGKIGVAEGILNKPGPLSPEEWRVVRAHPEMGARIISHIEYLGPAVGLILHHHERIDGRGYPHGLVGDDIELGARIVTVVDSFDAMTTHRPYRRAMDIPQAVKLLKVHAGRQFDAQIVDGFLDVLESGAIQPKA